MPSERETGLDVGALLGAVENAPPVAAGDVFGQRLVDVIVLGSVDVRRAGTSARRHVVWTWHVHDGKATSVRVADTGAAPEP